MKQPSKFPTITLASWPSAIRMARAERNNIREKIAAKILQRGGAQAGEPARSTKNGRPAATN